MDPLPRSKDAFFFLFLVLGNAQNPPKTKPIFASVPAGGWRWRSLKLGAGTGEGEGDGVRGRMRTLKQGHLLSRERKGGEGGQVPGDLDTGNLV
jgi:hypothetical protein